jgi:hypothetical protein
MGLEMGKHSLPNRVHPLQSGPIHLNR